MLETSLKSLRVIQIAIGVGNRFRIPNAIKRAEEKEVERVLFLGKEMGLTAN